MKANPTAEMNLLPKSAKAETLVRAVQEAAAYGAIASFLPSQWSEYVPFIPSLTSPMPPFAAAVNDLATIAFPIFAFLWLATTTDLWLLSQWRIKKTKEKRIAIEQGNIPLEPTPIFGPDSLIGVVWRATHPSTLQVNLKRRFLEPGTWVTMVLVSIGLSIFVSPDLTTGQTNTQHVIWAFFSGMIITASVLTGFVTIKVEQRFKTLGEFRDIFVIVEPVGLKYIEGSTILLFPWSEISSIRELGGIVLYKRRGMQCLVPDCAFRSRADAKAMLATLRSLKAGRTPPAYDWTGYLPSDRLRSDSWPPAIDLSTPPADL